MPAAGDAKIELIKVDDAGRGLRKVLVKCILDSGDGSFAVALSNAIMNKMAGRWCGEIVCYPGVTTPTTDSDIAIADSLGKAILTAAGNGLNLVDDADTRWAYPDGFAAAHPQRFVQVWADQAWTITITNNSVNSAVVFILFELTEFV